METNKILSASILDLLFEDRNKDYGAYELRITYPQRVKKSMIITISFALLLFTGSLLAKSLKPQRPGQINVSQVVLEDLKQEEKKPEQIPEKKPDPVEIKTQQFTTIVITKEEIKDPPPTQEELEGSKIDVFTKGGIVDSGFVEPKTIDEGKGIIEQKNSEPEIFTTVQIEAKFSGNWEKFLHQNLNAEVPVDNGAGVGRYTVIIQFVVDKEGNVSNIEPITNVGFGMEQEAMRVLRKAAKWEPAIQGGMKVKAYRKQPITFVVEAE